MTQQRWDESDEDYIKRKRRVIASYRMLGVGGGAYIEDEVVANICVTTIGTSGDKRGYIESSIGEISPNASYGGETIFEFTWDIVTGEFILSFDDGTLELTNVSHLLIKHPDVPDGNIALWDSSETAYVFTDLTLAQTIGVDEDYGCFRIESVPVEAVLYSFSEVLRGTAT